MPNSVIAVYNTVLKQVAMVLVDVPDASDPAWNPPDCIQVPIDSVQYTNLPTNEETYAFLQACIDEVMGQQS